MVCAPDWCSHELVWLIDDVVRCHRQDCQASSLANVHLHCHWSQFSKLCEHRSPCDLCQKLPRKQSHYAWPLKRVCWAQLYLAFYGNDRKALILLVGWLPALIGVIFVYTIRPMKVESKPNDLKVLFYFLFVSIAFALFLMAITLIQKSITFSKGTQALTATAVCFLLLFLCPFP